MVVVVVTNAPLSLRGHLARWLVEVAPGTYVGNPSARVRDRLWDRIVRTTHDGRATMAWSDGSELGFQVRTLNHPWKLIDFDGVRLPLRPAAGAVEPLRHQESSEDPDGGPPLTDLESNLAARKRAARLRRLRKH